MLIPLGPARYEIEIKRSRFIAEIDGCSGREDADEILSRRREDHPGAAHVVYAFSLGDEKNRQFGMSDDGEPKGTAGRPVLEVLRGSDVTDCILTVVRYFGGTKLGTGGLVHAYGDAAKGCIAAVETTRKRELKEHSIAVPYELYQPVRTIIEEIDGEILNEEFTETVTIVVGVDSEREGELRQRLENVSRGTVSF